jgi:dynein heavy chain
VHYRDTTLKLNRKVEDLEDVRYIMNTLKEVREKEANIDGLITPIEDMYALLLRYEVRVPKEETSMVSDLRYGWKKLRKLATDMSDNLTRLQVGTQGERFPLQMLQVKGGILMGWVCKHLLPLLLQV